MSAATATSFGATAWTTWRLRRAVMALHVVIVVIPVLFAIAGTKATGGLDAGPVVLAVAAGLALLALQLRHSLATMHSQRPRAGGWTLVGLAVLVYLPMRWFGWNWVMAEALLIASAFMVLQARPAIAVAIAVVLGTGVALARTNVAEGLPVGAVAFQVLYGSFALVAAATTLYGSARLLRMLDELHATRAELAELAVGRERLQLARNLHDLLGQRLSAISLKGDLALRLLGRDPPAARAEIQSLTVVARDALRDMQAVTRDQHRVALATELEGAATLLAAAGVQPHLDLDLPELPPADEEVLAWAVKEGVTNVLRHSQASTCSIRAGCRDGGVWLEIVNDWIDEPVGDGSGLAGLAGRARALGGTATAGPTGDGQFRLLVQLPRQTT